jgi:hypothetical protein
VQNETSEILGGILLRLRARIYAALEELDKPAVKDELLEKLTDFMTLGLNIRFKPKDLKLNKKKRIRLFHKLLDRPLRVCGMVPNTGEPGGGPFWVRQSGLESIQIVEKAQINLKQKEQENIFNQSTHFNPVDIACSILNYKGEKFDLLYYINHDTYFVSKKSKQGETIRVLELPGLWNGAMADWITVLVEVPVQTFNPVKEVNDLMKNGHKV